MKALDLPIVGIGVGRAHRGAPAPARVRALPLLLCVPSLLSCPFLFSSLLSSPLLSSALLCSALRLLLAIQSKVRAIAAEVRGRENPLMPEIPRDLENPIGR